MLTGLPLLGAWLAGRPAARYLQFPPDPGVRRPRAVFVGGVRLSLSPDRGRPRLAGPSRGRILAAQPPGRTGRPTPGPLVGNPLRGGGRGRLGPGLDPLRVVRPVPGAHVHPALAGLHHRRQRPVRRPDRTFAPDRPSGAAGRPLPGERALLVVLRVPQPVCRELDLHRRAPRRLVLLLVRHPALLDRAARGPEHPGARPVVPGSPARLRPGPAAAAPAGPALGPACPARRPRSG